VTRVELVTAASAAGRNRELASLAREHGARYVNVDVVVGNAQ
jgi:hypothetical protein